MTAPAHAEPEADTGDAVATGPLDLLADIERSAGGLTLAGVLRRHPELARRTAQRWLRTLVERRAVRPVGEGRARRYVRGVGMSLGVAEDTPEYTAGDVPVSADARDILERLAVPRFQRDPAPHDPGFLNRYVPNETFYLSASLRRELGESGRIETEDAVGTTYGAEITNRLLIDLSWASSRLEGNTYSRLDTLELLEEDRVPPGRSALETQMVLNHRHAIEMLLGNVGRTGFDRYTLTNVHAALSENLLGNAHDEGRLRGIDVRIGRSTFRPASGPDHVSAPTTRLLGTLSAIEDPFEQSFAALVHIPYLQPFVDVNKRTARLMANLPLFRNGCYPLTFVHVPSDLYRTAMLGVYELQRVELLRDLFVWAYRRSGESWLHLKRDVVEPDPFRLAHRKLVRRTVFDIVTAAAPDPLPHIERVVAEAPESVARENLRSLLIEALGALHEGSVARYGLTPEALGRWREATGTVGGGVA